MSPPGGRAVLVTGGAGFIGTNLVRMLLGRGYRVRILDNFSNPHQPDYLGGLEVEVVRGDIRQAADWDRILRGIDGVFHLAALSGVEDSVRDPENSYGINVGGTHNLLLACKARKIRRFVAASSNAPLGKQPPPVDEETAPKPLSPYGAYKLALEGMCLAFHGTFGLGAVPLRLSNVYGPFASHKTSVVSLFIKNVLDGEPLQICGDGSQTRDFIYVEDVCRAFTAAMESDAAGEIFQVGSGKETSILDLAALVREAAGGEPPKTSFAAARSGDMRRNFSRTDKAARVLGFSARTGLREGLKKTFEWFRANYRKTAPGGRAGA